MNYLDKYDNFVFKKCLDTRRVNTFELNNLAKGRVTKSHFGGYVAQKPLSIKDLVMGLSKHGFNSNEVLKGLDIDALLLEINQAGVQIEQIFGDGDDLVQMFADIPSDDEERQEALSPGFPFNTPERATQDITQDDTPEWLLNAERAIQQRTLSPDALIIGNNRTPEERSERRQSRRFFSPTFSAFAIRLRDAVTGSSSRNNQVAPSPEIIFDDEPDIEEDEGESDSDVSQATEPDPNPEYQISSQIGLDALEEQMRRQQFRQQVRQDNESRRTQIDMNW